MNHREESLAVRKALIEAGFQEQGMRIDHGNGAPFSWLNIQVSAPKGVRRKSIRDSVVRIAQKATGRHGDCDGCIGVNVVAER